MHFQKGSDVHNHLSKHYKGFALSLTPARPDSSDVVLPARSLDMSASSAPEDGPVKQLSTLLKAVTVVLPRD